MDIELGLEMEANTKLEKENRLLKSLLYCTTRSCNNCGKVNCENFQRQRKDCCGNWVSYKDYIKELEAKLKHAEENCINKTCVVFKDKEDCVAKLLELEKENADLKEEINKIAFARGNLEEENAELKGLKDVATLIRANNDTVTTLMQLNNMLVSKTQQLTKAKEIIKKLIEAIHIWDCKNLEEVETEAEQFLNSEVGK